MQWTSLANLRVCFVCTLQLLVLVNNDGLSRWYSATTDREIFRSIPGLDINIIRLEFLSSQLLLLIYVQIYVQFVAVEQCPITQHLNITVKCGFTPHFYPLFNTATKVYKLNSIMFKFIARDFFRAALFLSIPNFF